MDARQQEVMLLQPRARRLVLAAPCAALLLLVCACSGADQGAPSAGEGEEASYPESLPYARSVESFQPGSGAGFGEGQLPDVVLGPPRGKGERAGSLDVLSLGAGGEIVLGFGERSIEDEDGPDFLVFENAFWPGGDASAVYAELAEVSVSEDGETWLKFECDEGGDGSGHFPGCAGATPTLVYDPLELVPLDAEACGGDAFDLSEVGLARARYVRITDLSTLPDSGNTTGFDLDAVGLLHQD